MNNEILTSIQTSKNISAANGRSGNIRRKTPRIEQKIQLTIIAAMTMYSIIFLEQLHIQDFFFRINFSLLANDQYL